MSTYNSLIPMYTSGCHEGIDANSVYMTLLQTYELTNFQKMVRVWKTKSILFCWRYDPLMVFWM